MDTSTDMSNNCRTRWCGLTTKSICARGKKCISHLEKAQGRVLVFVGGGCRRVITRRESWQMSQVREPLPPGPEGPERAPTESSSLISLPRAQPQRLPQPNTSALERGEEESGKIQNGHAGLSNGSGIHNGVKHVPADNRKLSAPVSEKMHRKIQSTLSVNSNSSKKSKISSVFSQKPGTSPEVSLRLWVVSTVGATSSSPPPPARRMPVAPAGASVQGSAGARSKPLLRTSAATLIAVFSLFDSRCERAECLEICFELSELSEYS
ncbi:myoD family inhibitor domain-containing protein isoform 3-T3 [Alca torda]